MKNSLSLSNVLLSVLRILSPEIVGEKEGSVNILMGLFKKTDNTQKNKEGSLVK